MSSYFRQLPPPPSWRDAAKRFPLVFVPLATVSLLVAAGMYAYQASTDQAILDLDQRDHVKLQSEMIAADFRSVSADLLILARGRALRSLLDEPGSRAREKLADEFLSFLSHKAVYDQVRYIDAEGREVVRVNDRNGRPEIVPQNRLQRKADRYYFTETLRLSRGEVFVSPFDLNVEDGRIERPLKPTIRFATPVFDAAGRMRGIVVLNYLGARLIDKLRRHARNVIGDPWLLNANGYWLAGSQPEDEWGFMFLERGHADLAGRSPEAWQRISTEESGQFRDSSGMYTFRTAYPVRDIAARKSATSRSSGDSSNYHWKIVSYISPDNLSAANGRLHREFSIAGVALIAVLAAVAWFIARLMVQNRAARERLLRNERLAAVGEAMTALAHECRNALQRSRAGLELLAMRTAGDAGTRELLDEVQGAHNYLAELYDEVRGYAAPVNLHREPTDLQMLIQQTWSQVAEQNGAAPRPIEVEAGVPTECRLDPRAMSQVFRNLFDNALAAGSPAQVHVHITRGQLAGRPAVQIAVHDNGPGVPPEHRDRLFEPFFTTKFRGTGLGLAISRRLVEAHGGTITLAEPNGPGAEIRIVLPVES